MAGKSEIFRYNTEQWRSVLGMYDQVLGIKASKLSKTPTRPKGGKTLLELDQWQVQTSNSCEVAY